MLLSVAAQPLLSGFALLGRHDLNFEALSGACMERVEITLYHDDEFAGAIHRDAPTAANLRAHVNDIDAVVRLDREEVQFVHHDPLSRCAALTVPVVITDREVPPGDRRRLVMAAQATPRPVGPARPAGGGWSEASTAQPAEHR